MGKPIIDALLYAVRDTIRAANVGFGKAECEIMDDGRPPARCGKVFAAVHGGTSNSDSDNQLHEYYGFLVTLTMRVIVPLDRVGDQQISRNAPRKLDPNMQLAEREGFYAKCDILRRLLSMNWNMVVVQRQTPPSANDNLAAWSLGNSPADILGQTIYGFVEPARYRGMEAPKLVGGEWFGSEPDATDVGIKTELRFDGARRFQPQTQAVGPFV